MEADTPVEMTFVLPIEIVANPRAVVFCEARIVRTVMPAIHDGHPCLGARILKYIPTSEWKLKPRLIVGDGWRRGAAHDDEFDTAKILPALFH